MKFKTKYILIIFIFLLLTILYFGDNQVLAAESGRIINGMIYNIKNVNSGKYLNVNLATDANGTNVNQWTGDGSQEQKFRVVYYNRYGNEDAYRIYPMCSSKGGNRVLDVLRTGGSASGSIVSGNNVDIWTTGDDDCQFFIITMESSSNNIFKFSIKLKSNPNLALTAYGTGNGSGAGNTSTSAGNVYISTWTGSNSQLWTFEEVSGTPAYPYRMTKGIGYQTYYVDSTASKYSSYISNGASRWNPTVILSQASTNASTAVDFYEVGNDHFNNVANLGNWLAATTYHTPSHDNILYPEYNGWNFSKVSINKDKYLTVDYITTDQRYGVIAHEIGHAFGLQHFKRTSSLMYPTINVSGVPTTPQTIDRQGLTYKY